MNETRPLVIGLLGGIASGKSQVAGILADQGATVLDADRAAREILDAPEIVAALIARHGSKLEVGGRIDRAALAAATFGHPEALSHLERLIHPRVRAFLATGLERALGSPTVPAVVLDVPLLLESSPLAPRCDLLIFVECPAPERRKRRVHARGWTEDEITRRESHQLPLDEKRRRADVVFLNDGTVDQLRQQVLGWLNAAGGFAAVPRRAQESLEAPSNERPRDAPPSKDS